MCHVNRNADILIEGFYCQEHASLLAAAVQ